MYGDTTTIRLLADRLRRQAVDIRAEADLLRVAVESTPWQGLAADAMRETAHRRLADLSRSADRHDGAAADLDRHATVVDERKHLIVQLEREARRLVGEARGRLARAHDLLATGIDSVLPDPVDELLDRAVLPPPGHRDWLDLSLPGLPTPGDLS